MSQLHPDGRASHAHASGRQDLPRLTALRGIGAIVIVLGHCALVKSLTTKAADDLVISLMQPLGVAGVSCFFTLSGFVLTWVTPRGTGARRIWRNRFARIYPLHVITWALGAALLWMTGALPELWKLIPSLLLLNVWVPQLEVFYGTNIPSWTLAVEAFFYVLFPLALVAVWRLPERWLWRAVLLVGAMMTAWAAAVGLVISDAVTITDGTPLSRNQYFAIVTFPPARLLDFALGMLLARIVIARRAPSGLRPWLYLTLIGGYVAARWIIPEPLGYICAFFPAVVVGLLYSAQAELDGRPSRWSVRPLVWMGELSFPLYLVHWSVLWGAYAVLGEPIFSLPAALLFALGVLTVSTGAAQLLHTLVEVPFYRRFGGRRTRRATADAAAPGVRTATS